MTLTEHIDIELILIEANAYGLREEVQKLATELAEQDESLTLLDAYTLAYRQTILLSNV